MNLRRACELLSQSHGKGNPVDFWKAVGYIEQALEQLHQAESAAETDAVRVLRITTMTEARWHVLFGGISVAALTDAELHALTDECLAAQRWRQGV